MSYISTFDGWMSCSDVISRASRASAFRRRRQETVHEFSTNWALEIHDFTAAMAKVEMMTLVEAVVVVVVVMAGAPDNSELINLT